MKKKIKLLSELGFTSHYFGHPIQWDGDEWLYRDNQEPIHSSPRRKCPKCHELPTSEGHDPCSANLPGVSNACCGHGVAGGYIQFNIEMEKIPDFNVKFKIEDNGYKSQNPKAKTIRFENTDDYLSWVNNYKKTTE